MSGRFAPSPTGDLHMGNLRTALVAWVAARADAIGFLVRMEDLDRATSSERHADRQLADLAAIGVTWDRPVVRQSERFERYHAAIGHLDDAGLVYPCYCTRREIRAEIEAAASAPHGDLPDGAYPGTCRELSSRRRSAREAEGRPAALRLRTEHEQIGFEDRLHGHQTGRVDDVVLRRNDGVPAYNLAVVVDDAAQGVTQVVRGDDLLASTPRQIHLQRLLGLATPEYLHVPLVVGADGERLAKRHGAVTLGDLTDRGVPTGDVLAWLAGSLGFADTSAGPLAAGDLIERFDPARIPRRPIVLDPLQIVIG